MKYYVIIDTNVIISALRSENGASFKLLTLLNDKIFPVYNDKILSEYIEVANRKSQQEYINNESFKELINLIKEIGIKLENDDEISDFLRKWISDEESEKLSIDKDDMIFYEITFYVNNIMSEDAKLVTYNKKHFPMKTFVVNPDEMLKIIEKDNFKKEFYNEIFKINKSIGGK